MINDYSTLQAAIADWLKRADLTTAIPSFIALAEARINRTLFVTQRQAEASGTSASGVVPIPADLDRLIAFQVSRGSAYVPIDPVPPNVIRGWNGAAVVYTTVNGEYRLSGSQDIDYVIDYYARIPALSDAAPQHWLLTKEPGLYLYGALIEATPYIQDDARAMIWATQFQTILDDLARSDEYTRYGNAPAAAVRGCAP